MNSTETRSQIAEQIRRSAFKICDAAFSTLGLMLALQQVASPMSEYTQYIGAALFFVLALSQVFNALSRGFKKRLSFIKFMAFGAAFAGCSAILIYINDPFKAFKLVAEIYFTVLFANRVLVMIEASKNPNWFVTKIVFNVLIAIMLALIVFVIYETEYEQYLQFKILLHIFIGVKALVHIIVTSFSQIRLDVLLRIIRKTYASEILFGMMMLIVAFSMVLVVWDPGIKTFYDGLWYCFAIVTTIGFGDITATSWIGRTLSVILGLYGIVVVALITSIIINFYGEVKNDKDFRAFDKPETEAPAQEAGGGEKSFILPNKNIKKRDK